MAPPDSKDARFEAIYLDNQEDLFAYINRSVRESNTAMDLLQDAFANFFRIFRERDLPPDIECRMYIFRIARNLMINQSKAAYSRKVDLIENYEARGTSNPEQAGPEEQVVEAMETEAQERLLNEMLQELPEDQRTAMVLRYSQDMKLEDIAEILDVSISTVSRTLTRARETLVRESKKRGL